MCCASGQLYNCYFESSKNVLQGFRLPMRAGQQACMDRLHTSGDVGTPVLLNTALWHVILLVDIFYILIVKKNHSFIFPFICRIKQTQSLAQPYNSSIVKVARLYQQM